MKSYIINALCRLSCVVALTLFVATASQAHQGPQTTPEKPQLEELDGGPRTVIQGMADIQVSQATADYLLIVIYNQDGHAVHQCVTYSHKTVISTLGWASGNYQVYTEDAAGDVQTFRIYIE